MKKLLILLMASLLTLSTALAEVIYSPEVTALKAALAALREEYGFTLTTAGVFYPEVTLTENGAQVVFQPCTYLPVDRLGEYTAVITGEDVALTWSHADRAADLTAAPECPIWGHAQVQTYFDQGVIARDTWVENYISPTQESLDIPDINDNFAATWIPLDPQDIPKDQLRQTAKATFAEIFAMTSEEINAMYIETETGYYQCADGRAYWSMRGGDVNYFVTLLIDKETSEVYRITLFSGGLG